MKIIKPKPKCKGCGHWHIMIHCESVMTDGCDTDWCYLCWPEHADMHQKEWDKMSEVDKDKIIRKYGG